MPVIRIMKWDLERLVGRKFSTEEILDLLPRVKCEIELIEKDIIEYEATHDRPDLYSVEGLARSIRYLLRLPVQPIEFIDEGYKAYSEEIPQRPYAAFGIVRDLDLDDEAVKQIMQLQEKLATTYGRRRRKASIGVYDLDKIKLPVYYELRDPDNTRFVPLDETREMSLREILEKTEKGREYGWIIREWPKYPVLRDSENRILSLVPIINSEETRVTEETTSVLIDSTGTDASTVIDMVTIMATSIAERSKSRRVYIVETIIPNGTSIRAPREKGPVIKALLNNINKLLGLNLSMETAIELLHRMGFEKISTKGDELIVEIPPYRIDVKNWVDLAEDIAMAYGYDRLGVEAIELPPATHPGRIHPLEYLSRVFRKILVEYGFIEVANYMMSNPFIQAELFGSSSEIVTVQNPKMEKYTGLRIWLTPGLLEVIARNQEREREIRIFEIGDVVIPDKEYETGARSERRVGIAISHDKATLTDGLAITSVIIEAIGKKPVYEKTEIPGLLKERTAEIIVDNEKIGFVGEIHPRILKRLGIEKPVVVSEITLNKLLDVV
ncbi:MAG: phenylalanine--tRNA ligase subunit beta [Thermoprotei archaeon]